jgi:hypothetical protein
LARLVSQALLDQVHEVDGVLLRQANAIASELCTNIKFVSQLVTGSDGYGRGDVTIDELVDGNVCRIKVGEQRKPREREWGKGRWSYPSPFIHRLRTQIITFYI